MRWADAVLEWLTKRFRARRVTDPVFGDLLYMGGYWEGAGQFGATREPIEWFVDADEKGPGESQRALSRKIVERYPELARQLRVLLEAEVVSWAGTGAAEDPMKSVKLAAVSVPARESPEMEWQLSYSTDLPGGPHFDGSPDMLVGQING